ncbi:hypothetical protein J2W79_000471 [Methylorubrum extorquens]|nr:hypothetical protein [Methylorubrum extorquens]
MQAAGHMPAERETAACVGAIASGIRGGEAKNKAAGGRTPPYRLYGLQPTIPHLTRASLHRCLERHGISRRPEVAGNKP